MNWSPALLWLKLATWLRALWAARRRRPAYGLVFVEEEPDELEPLKLYAVGENGHLWHVTMLCPCGCRERVSLNLLPDDFPCWTLLNDAGTPTLRPSVWRKVGCRSHYILRGGRIIWCSASAASSFSR